MPKPISQQTRLALSKLTEEEIRGLKEVLRSSPIPGVCPMCLRECAKGEKVCRECRGGIIATQSVAP